MASNATEIQLTIASGDTTASVEAPPGWAAGDKLQATVETFGANPAHVSAICTGGLVTVTASTDPGAGGMTINVAACIARH